MYETLLVETGQGKWAVSTLPDSVADTIVGMYKIYTGKLTTSPALPQFLNIYAGSGDQTADVSWWPRQAIWNSSGFNCGQWTSECEEWFRRRVKDIKAGIAVPRNAREWRSALRLRASTTRKMMRSLKCAHGNRDVE